MSIEGGSTAGDQILDDVLDEAEGWAGTTGGGTDTGTIFAEALEPSTEFGEGLLYGESGLGGLADGAGDLLPLFEDDDDILGLGFGVSLPFCCCLHLALLFLNQTCKTEIIVLLITHNTCVYRHIGIGSVNHLLYAAKSQEKCIYLESNIDYEEHSSSIDRRPLHRLYALKNSDISTQVISSYI